MKNSILLSALFILLSCTSLSIKPALPPPPSEVKAIEASDTTKLPIPDYTQKRMNYFASQDTVALQGCTVFLGDSITEGFKIENYFTGEKIANRGISSDRMGVLRGYGVYNRLSTSVYNLNPKRIILLIGVNDTPSMKADPNEKSLWQYDYLVWKIRHDLPKTELWCISIFPTRDKYDHLNPVINIFNQHAQSAALKYGAHWLNIHDQLTDAEGKLKLEWTRDGLHVNTLAYDVIAAAYNKEILKK